MRKLRVTFDVMGSLLTGICANFKYIYAMSILDIFLSAFIALFVVVDPIGTSGIFAVLTRRMDNHVSRRIAIKAGMIAAMLLIVFGFIGAWLLSQLGITLAAFRIGGGILLFVTAFRMIMGFHDPDQLESEKAYGRDQNIAVFPLAIPLLSGPGCMTAVLLHMTAHPGEASAKFAVIAAIIAVEIIAIVLMLFSKRFIKLMGETGSSLLARVLGILLAALAVQFIADGITVLFLTPKV